MSERTGDDGPEVRQLLVGTDELWDAIRGFLKQRGLGVAGPLPLEDDLPTFVIYPIQPPPKDPS